VDERQEKLIYIIFICEREREGEREREKGRYVIKQMLLIEFKPYIHDCILYISFNFSYVGKSL
jgi:hypothetical protein